MFICDEVRAEASAAAATTRLAILARRTSLAQASHAAWDAGIARTGQAGLGPGQPRLVRVHCQGPAQRGAVSLLLLRWEAMAGNGRPFPALDADITLLPDAEHGILVGLTGVYRTPEGTRPDRPAVGLTAAVTVRTLLSRIADAIGDPAAPPGGGAVAVSIAPGALAGASP